MSQYLTFSEAASALGISLERLSLLVLTEHLVQPVRRLESCQVVTFEFRDILIGDQVTREGVILARTNTTGDIYRQVWANVPAGQLLIVSTDLEVLRTALEIAGNRKDAMANDHAGTESGITWKQRIQEAAAKRWLDLEERSMTPTLQAVSDDMATWCRDHEVRTASGVYPQASYIKQHVLSGNYWTPPGQGPRRSRTPRTNKTSG